MFRRDVVKGAAAFTAMSVLPAMATQPLHVPRISSHISSATNLFVARVLHHKRAPQQLDTYAFYVEYLEYTAEQTSALGEGWDQVFLPHFATHAAIICENFDWLGDTAPVAALLRQTRMEHCATLLACP